MILEKSCGAIVYTVEDGDIKYLLVEEMSGCHSFPKGHMENYETEEESGEHQLSDYRCSRHYATGDSGNGAE